MTESWEGQDQTTTPFERSCYFFDVSSDTAEMPRQRTFIEAARRAQIVAAAIDTIAEVGFAQASLARIGERIGISKGLIGYHFAGKDDLIKQVVFEILEQGKSYMRPRILAEAATGPGFLRAYIESNLAFMKEHRNHMVAIVGISRGGSPPAVSSVSPSPRTSMKPCRPSLSTWRTTRTWVNSAPTSTRR